MQLSQNNLQQEHKSLGLVKNNGIDTFHPSTQYSLSVQSEMLDTLSGHLVQHLIFVGTKQNVQGLRVFCLLVNAVMCMVIFTIRKSDMSV